MSYETLPERDKAIFAAQKLIKDFRYHLLVPQQFRNDYTFLEPFSTWR